MYFNKFVSQTDAMTNDNANALTLTTQMTTMEPIIY